MYLNRYPHPLPALREDCESVLYLAVNNCGCGTIANILVGVTFAGLVTRAVMIRGKFLQK